MEEQKKGGRGGGRCLSWRVVGVPDSADGNLMVLSCLCWISATCPTRVFLPLFSTLLFAPGGCISQALLPSSFSWAWLIASPGGMGRGREQWVQGVYFPNSLCKKAMLSWLCFFTKGDCSSQDSYSTQLPPFQFLVISPSYWAKASWILILGSFTFYRHLYLKKKKKPSSHFSNLSASSTSCWDPVSLYPPPSTPSISNKPAVKSEAWSDSS